MMIAICDPLLVRAHLEVLAEIFRAANPNIAGPGGQTKQEPRRQFYSEVLARVRALPGVEPAAAVLMRPLSGAVGWDTVYTVDVRLPGQPNVNQNPNGNYEAISPGYFRTVGIRLLAGRDFTAADTATAPGVVIVDDGRPLGLTFTFHSCSARSTAATSS